MTIPVSYPAVWDDQAFYPLHEEDDVPEIPPHEATNRYLRDALAAHFPDWFVTGDVCIYWEPGNTAAYRAPDALVVKEPLAETVERVYQTWKQPPVAFVAEIGSRSTLRVDEGPKVEVYQDQVRAGEYFYADPPHGEQWLWRMGVAGYEAVAPEANGRLRSRELGLEFALEAGELRLYTLTGELLLDHVETDVAWREAEAQRAEEARRREAAEAGEAEETRRREAAEAREAEETRRREAAEAREAGEARRREAAEAREAEETRRREAAEAREAEETRRREAAEARAAELERQLAELRASRE